METLVTGFGPFGAVQENPSQRLAEASGLPFQILEVSYRAVEAFLSTAPRFDRLLMIGVAANSQRMRAEHIGRNIIGPTPDIEGIAGPAQIDPQAPYQLGSTFNWSPLPAEIDFSMDAGTYLCNYALFRALQTWPNRQIGFLHIPKVDQVPLESQLDQLHLILGTATGPSQTLAPA